MARKTRKADKGDFIRSVLSEDPTASREEIQKRGKEKGISLSKNYIFAVRGRFLKAKTPKAKPTTTRKKPPAWSAGTGPKPETKTPAPVAPETSANKINARIFRLAAINGLRETIDFLKRELQAGLLDAGA